MKKPNAAPSSPLSIVAILLGLLGLAWFGGELSLGQVGIARPLVFAVLAASAAVLVAGFVGVARLDRDVREWVAGDHPLARQQLAENIGAVLAHWSYAPDEWAAYVVREREAQKRDGRIIMIFLGALVGVMAFGAGLPLYAAALIAVGSWVVGVRAYPRSMEMTRQLEPGDAAPSATLASNAVLFHGRRLFLKDEGSSIARVRYVDGDAPHVAVTVHRSGGTGAMVHDIRIPVPRGREEEARAVAAHFPRRVPSAAPVG